MRVALAGIIPSEEGGLFSADPEKKTGAQMKNTESGEAPDKGVGDASQPVAWCCGALPYLEQAVVGYLLL